MVHSPKSRSEPLFTWVFAFWVHKIGQVLVDRTLEGKRIAKKNPDFREGRPPKFTEAQIKHGIFRRS